MLNRLRSFPRRHPNITLLLVVLLLIALAQLFLGTRATPLLSAEDLSQRLADGRPTVLEFYSNL